MRNLRAFPGQFWGAGMGFQFLFQWETSEMPGSSPQGVTKGSTRYPPGMSTQWMGTETKYLQTRWGHRGPDAGKKTILNVKGLFWCLNCFLLFPLTCSGWHLGTLTWVGILWGICVALASSTVIDILLQSLESQWNWALEECSVGLRSTDLT